MSTTTAPRQTSALPAGVKQTTPRKLIPYYRTQRVVTRDERHQIKSVDEITWRESSAGVPMSAVQAIVDEQVEKAVTETAKLVTAKLQKQYEKALEIETYTMPPPRDRYQTADDYLLELTVAMADGRIPAAAIFRIGPTTEGDQT